MAAAALALVTVWAVAASDQAQYATDGQTPSPSPSVSASSPSAAPSTPSSTPSSPTASEPAPQPTPTTTVNGVVLPDAEVAPPVTFEQKAQIEPDFAASVTSIKAIDGVGQGIGEISGPALAFTVSLTNNTTKPLETLGVVVNCYDGTSAPAIPLQGDPHYAPLPDSVAPGATATGVYVFRIPPEARDNITLTVAFDPASPTVVFTGAPQTN